MAHIFKFSSCWINCDAACDWVGAEAEAELAALEALRLSRAMAYVSINPSRVGGCMSLEEVRSKQQQEMMQAKRKQKPV